MYTYCFNIPLAFLFCRPLPSTVLVIFPEINILKRNVIKIHAIPYAKDQKHNVLTVSIDECLYTVSEQWFAQVLYESLYLAK